MRRAAPFFPHYTKPVSGKQWTPQRTIENMNNYLALGLASLTVIINGLIGHFFPPNGIMLTPIVLIITSTLICFGTKNIRAIFISILTFLFVALNDIFIKLYSGGAHDNEGLAWVHLLLFIGLIPTFGILMTAFFKLKDERLRNKILAIVLFIGLTVIHLKLFNNLGLGRHYWYEWNG